MSNRLKNESSPYLLQHENNPVHWFPWCEEAFEKARNEDKPIFLSIGYSSCHWCHVMAHESFEDEETARILNEHFVSIKVDKEERPDIDSVYMAVCLEFTGSGGWPTSIFMTAGQKPFYAGTYFPKTARFGAISFKELLLLIADKWKNKRELLLNSAEGLCESLQAGISGSAQADEALIKAAAEQFGKGFDQRFGGFGRAPKFPAAHNLLFLMQRYTKNKDSHALYMAELSLEKMYRGGMFDHIGYGFCRYSTDPYFLVPHFEKMLYDNALLILAYCRAYDITGKALYLSVAEKNAAYILREMTAPEGGFYSAQDADSQGKEGKYYVFSYDEITKLLGSRDGPEFNDCFGISESGNFEGMSIPNLLHSEPESAARFERFLPKLREYRKNRCPLFTDDKILSFWNGLMIAAMCSLYRSSQESKYLEAARNALTFIESRLFENGQLHVSWRQGRLGGPAFLDDYAGIIFACLAMYDVCYEPEYLSRAQELSDMAIELFFDHEHGGFFLSGKNNERLIHRPKDCSDGAVPSGNSLMAYNLVRLNLVCDCVNEQLLQKQMEYVSAQAERYPAGHAMFLTALSDYLEAPTSISAVKGEDGLYMLPFLVPPGAVVRVFDDEQGDYKRLHGKSTFYVCKNQSCLPPVNWQDLLAILK